MGPCPRWPITQQPGPQTHRIRLGPQQGTPQIFARVQASMEKRLQEDTKEQGGQQKQLQGSRVKEEVVVAVAVAAISRPSRRRLRAGTCGPSRLTGSPSA